MNDWRSKWRRIWALTRKETRQILRDPSSIAIGIVFPVMMILLFGFGLSLDVTKVSVAVVDEDVSADSAALIGDFRLSPYFVLTATRSMAVATALMLDRKVDGILQIPPDFSRRFHAGAADIQILVDGTDSNQARIMQAYAAGPVAIWSAAQAQSGTTIAVGPVALESRLWFNEANDSHYFLVPGLIVLVMTIIGAFLTAMVVAREWERGTLEALFVTPMQPGEFLISKFIPYFGLGMIGFLLCLLAGQFLFHVPLQGSLALLCVASMVYLLVALGIGLLVSTLVKSQFLASQLAMLLTFLPAMMLSGFMFDLRSMPAVVRGITYVLPARYAVSLLQTLYLAGNVGSVIVPNLAVLAAMGAALMLMTRLKTVKRIT
ncbi:MAG: ABC transporter permease [Steroidobacteraceae bacterium]|jgi:ABC-2 type transport system permease protein